MTVDHWKGAVPVAAAKAVAGDAGAGGVGAADVGVSQVLLGVLMLTVAPPGGNAAVVWDAVAVAVSLQGAATLPAAAEWQFLPVSACVGAYFSALAHRIAWSAQHYPTPWLGILSSCSHGKNGICYLLLLFESGRCHSSFFFGWLWKSIRYSVWQTATRCPNARYVGTIIAENKYILKQNWWQWLIEAEAKRPTSGRHFQRYFFQ